MSPRESSAFAALLITLMHVQTGCGPEAEPEPQPRPQSSQAKPEDVPVDPATVPLPQVSTGTLTVRTPEPGYHVFVDGEPARTSDGDLLLTPCRLTVRQGSREILVARPGFRDTAEVAYVGDSPSSLDILMVPKEDAPDGVLGAPYLETPLHEPIPLSTLNTPSAESDPCLSPDGRTICFVGRRAEGTGIYVATRKSAYHAFDPPAFIRATESLDVPAAPSLADDATLLVYAVPGKQRIYTCRREFGSDLFHEKELIQFAEAGGASWASAQMLPDMLRLYWTEFDADGNALRGFASVRKSVEYPWDRSLAYDLPGGHPCLSADGLRQYAFDGRVLQRARRASLSDRFSALEEVVRLDLPEYVAAPDRRQFFVSDDEQWLVYADRPDRGDLYLVRLSSGPGWGPAPHGEPLPPTEVSVAVQDRPAPTNAAQVPSSPEQDPRSLPLPYAEHRDRLVELLANRRYDEAAEQVRQAQSDPRLEPARELLAWDLQDVEHIQAMWAAARRALQAMPVGTAVRIGSAKLDFARFEEDVLVATARGKEFPKPIAEMDANDLAALVPETSDSQLWVGTFLHYDTSGSERSAALRLARAGEAGREFRQRLAQRLLHVARQELDRGNVAAGLARIDELLERHADTNAAGDARRLQDEVYTRIEWKMAGERKWENPEPGTYIADLVRRDDSLLISSREYENFELRMEWKVEDSPLAQGGVFFRYNGGPRPYSNAFKLHLANDAGRAPDPQSTGALFNYQAADANPAKPAGEWNTLVLRVRGEEVTAVINGQTVMETVASNERIPLKGYVALDGIIGGIAYRRVLLVELPPEESSQMSAVSAGVLWSPAASTGSEDHKTLADASAIKREHHSEDDRGMMTMRGPLTALLVAVFAPLTATAAEFSVAAFSAEVTVPLGHRCMGILPTKAARIDDPLEAHGFVLLGGERPVVLLALDWCEVRNGAYDRWRDALAEAAGTARECVLVCALHQHDAPVVDSGAQALLDSVGLEHELYDTAFHDECVRRVAAALTDSLNSPRRVSHLGLGQAKVEKVASSRRVVLPDGRVSYDRYSASGGDAFHREAPEGEIDPLLRTLSFWDGSTPVLALHAYATHPMSYYGRGGVSADFVGLARRLRQRDEPRVPQIYVSGCSGDVTAGKYNDGTPAMREVLAKRLHAAMRQAWDDQHLIALEAVELRTTALELPFHEGKGFTREALTETLNDPQAKTEDRILAAMGLSSLDRLDRGQPIDFPCLDLGPAQIVLFPGESFIGYQLMAQRMRPDSFVMSIGYGECWPGYVPTQAAFDEGFNHDWRWSGPGSEERIRAALERVLPPEE